MVLEQVEALQPRRVGEVRRIRMRRESEVRVGRVCLCQVRNEVVETSVVRVADRPDLLEELPRWLRIRVWRVGNKDEADLALSCGSRG